MAPECFEPSNKHLSDRADVFALGTLLVSPPFSFSLAPSHRMHVYRCFHDDLGTQQRCIRDRHAAAL